MGIAGNFYEALNRAGKNVKKTYDINALRRRILAYDREEKECLRQMGEIYYGELRRGITTSERRLGELAENVDNLRYRKAQLDRYRREMAEVKKEPARDSPTIRISTVGNLARSENDILIRRTEEGIAMVRLCPACGAENPSEAAECRGCGAEFGA